MESSELRKYFCTVQLLLVATIVMTISNVGVKGSPNSKEQKFTKPAMGWNSYKPFGCGKHVKEHDIRYQADLLVQKGLDKCGYNTITVECGWEGLPDNEGVPSIKKKAFNDGLAHFSEYLKGKGLRLGLSTWGGYQMCSRRTRRRRRDVLSQKVVGQPSDNEKKYWKNYMSTLAGWGLTYLMHRPCDWAGPWILQSPNEAKALNSRYVLTRDAISASGANIYYATGEWGVSPEVQDRFKVANSARISDDAYDDWNSFIRILNGLVPFAGRAGPGAFNDLGFLQPGKNHLKGPEKISQFIFWAAAKSPLIFSEDLGRLDEEAINMLKNPGALGVHQDDLGKSITLKRRYSRDMDVWSGPLSDGSTVAVVINWSWERSSKKVDLADLGFASAHLYDLWNGVDLGKAEKTYNATMGYHGSLFLKLNDTKPITKPNLKRYPAEKADLMGSARLKQVNSQVQAVSLIKPNGLGGVRWKNLPGGQKKQDVLVSIDYINAEISRGNVRNGKLNYKSAVIIVNDDQRIPVDFPISGQTWEDVYEGFLVSLPFEAGESNKVTIEGVDDWAPDIVSLNVQVQEM